MSLRVVFIGASSFGAKCFEACMNIDGVDVVGALTAPKVFSISYRPEGVKNVLFQDFSLLASKYKIPVLTLEKGMDDSSLFESVRRLEPDAFIVCGWYHMIPKRWRELAPSFGLHASLLPKYGGGAPLVWAIINGERKTGISFFQMDDGVDTGVIYGQREELISDDDTIATLYERIEERGIELIKDILPKLAAGTATYTLQNESIRTTFPQRSPEDGLISWNNSAIEVDRFIRAQTRPYPGAYIIVDDQKLYIWKAKKRHNRLEPGKVSFEGGAILIGCKEGAIEIMDMSYNNATLKGKEILDFFNQRELLFSNIIRRYDSY